MPDNPKPPADQARGPVPAEAENADVGRAPPAKEGAVGGEAPVAGETDDPADIVDEHRTERPVEDLGGEID